MGTVILDGQTCQLCCLVKVLVLFSATNELIIMGRKIIVQLSFTIVLFILFIIFFGYPALQKYMNDEVFIKVSATPKDRTKVAKLELPAVTFCGSQIKSALTQVKSKS